MKFSLSINPLFFAITITFVLGVLVSPISDTYILGILGVLSIVFLFVLKQKKTGVLLSLFLFFCLGNLRSIVQQKDVQRKVKGVSIEHQSIAFEILKENNNFETTLVYKVNFFIKEKNLKIVGFVYVPKDFRSLEIGKTYLTYNKLQAIKSFKKPYSDTYFNYLKGNHITHKVYLKTEPIEVLSTNFSISRWMRLKKMRVVGNLEKYPWSPKVLGFIKAFVLGDRSDISKALKQDFKNAGLLHILAISGLHIGILHQVLILFFRNILYHYKYRWVKSIIILILLWTYVFFIGFPIAAIRAASMFSLFEISTKLYRKQHPIDILSLFVFFMVFIDPFVIRNVGFQLSVVAVLSIVIGMPIWKKLWTPSQYWVLLVWQLIGVSLFAQLGILPLLIHYFHQFPLLFLVANIPVLLVMPIVFITSLMVVLWMQAFERLIWIVKIYEIGIQYLLSYIEWIASFESTILKSLRLGNIGLIIVYIGAVFLLTMRCFQKNKSWQSVFVVNVFIVYLILNHWVEIQKNSLWVLEEKQEVFVADQLGNQLKLYSSSTKKQKDINFIKYWSAEVAFRGITKIPLKNSYQILRGVFVNIIEEGINMKINEGAICIVKGNPKINMKRILKAKPSLIIFSSDTKRYLRDEYQKTCNDYKIPIWDLKKQGGINLLER